MTGLVIAITEGGLVLGACAPSPVPSATANTNADRSFIVYFLAGEVMLMVAVSIIPSVTVILNE